MAEAAGLAIGVIALAGVFKDCVDLFDYFCASRSLGRDYELLETKLDIEKTLLLQWAERVRLLDVVHGCDERLRNPVAAELVSRILASLKLLLSESGHLQGRYGATKTDGSDAIQSPVATVSSLRKDRFVRDFEDFSLRVEQRQNQTPFFRKFRWVIHDKDKFDDLVQQTSYFISKLNEVVPDRHSGIAPITSEDLKHLPDLSLLLEATQSLNGSLEQGMKKVIAETQILRCLWFRSIDNRRTNIEDAHLETLNWALEPPKYQNARWDSLSEWLRAGSGIYWVSGKAGSGKSTLMKSLWYSERAKKLLDDWASPSPYPIVRSSFFFYFLGTIEQKSLDFMCRGLLYYILESEPTMIPAVLPNMWREAQYTSGSPLTLPSLAEMTEALRSLGSNQLDTRRFCIFIDGLDEFSGSCADAVKFIKRLAACQNVKVLVSSRPIPACVQAFAAGPSLRLQDLNRVDIVSYVDSVVGGDSRMQGLTETYPDDASKIITDLVEKSSGIFLWVVLACRSVLDGLAAFDSITELQERVDELPPELEDLFRHMLERIEQRYRLEASKLLLLCFHSRRVQGMSKVYSIALALADEYGLDPARVPEARLLTLVEKKRRCQELEGRLRGRCCGLLELDHSSSEPDQPCFCESEDERPHDKLIDSHVQFIHRTVFDYLDGLSTQALLGFSIQGYSPEKSKVWVCLSLHTAQACCSSNSEAPMVYLVNALYYVARYFGHADAMTIWPLVVKFEAVFLQLFPDPEYDTTYLHSARTSSAGCCRRTALLAVELGLVSVLDERPTTWACLLERHSHLLTQAIMRPILSYTSPWWPVSPHIDEDVIHHLLAAGCNPNEQISSHELQNVAHGPWCDYKAADVTPWLLWAHGMLARAAPVASALAITKTFLEHGADIEAVESTMGRPIEDILRQVVAHVQPENASRQPVPRAKAGLYGSIPEPSVGDQENQHATEDSLSGSMSDEKGSERGQYSARLGELFQIVKLRRKSGSGA